MDERGCGLRTVVHPGPRPSPWPEAVLSAPVARSPACFSFFCQRLLFVFPCAPTPEENTSDNRVASSSSLRSSSSSPLVTSNGLFSSRASWPEAGAASCPEAVSPLPTSTIAKRSAMPSRGASIAMASRFSLALLKLVCITFLMLITHKMVIACFHLIIHRK